MKKIPVEYRLSVREWHGDDNSLQGAVTFFLANRAKPERCPTIRCGSTQPTDAKNRLISSLIECHEPFIVHFDKLDEAVTFFLFFANAKADRESGEPARDAA